MRDVQPKTHIATDRLFVIARETDAQFVVHELQHVRRCLWCIERFSFFVRQSIQISEDPITKREFRDENRTACLALKREPLIAKRTKTNLPKISALSYDTIHKAKVISEEVSEEAGD